MHTPSLVVRTLAISLLAINFLAASVEPVTAQVSEDQIRQNLEEDYGVTVLRMREIVQDGKPVFAVTMMSPGGNFNEAFQVNTVVVDPETGKLVSQYRARTNGIQHAAPPITHRTHPLTEDSNVTP